MKKILICFAFFLLGSTLLNGADSGRSFTSYFFPLERGPMPHISLRMYNRPEATTRFSVNLSAPLPFIEKIESVATKICEEAKHLTVEVVRILSMIPEAGLTPISSILPSANVHNLVPISAPSPHCCPGMPESLLSTWGESQFISSLKIIVKDALDIEKNGILTNFDFGSLTTKIKLTYEEYAEIIYRIFPGPAGLSADTIHKAILLRYSNTEEGFNEIAVNVRRIWQTAPDLTYYHPHEFSRILTTQKFRLILGPRGWRWPQTFAGTMKAYEEIDKFFALTDEGEKTARSAVDFVFVE